MGLFNKLFKSSESDDWAAAGYRVTEDSFPSSMTKSSIADEFFTQMVMRQNTTVPSELQTVIIGSSVEEPPIEKSLIKPQQNIDELIHKDVDSAIEALLAETEVVLEVPADEETIKRLTKLRELGFSRVQDIKDFENKMGKYNHLKQRQDLINYYKQTYPLNKFIEENAVKSICSKYNLILSDTSNYTGEIPEKNQNEIINFKIKLKDIEIIRREATRNDHYHTAMGIRTHGHVHIREYRQQWNGGIYSVDEIDHSDDLFSGQSLQIVAPPQMFDAHGMERIGHQLYNMQITVTVKDPIVLQPVKGGFLIVSAWGHEAADPLVVNEINN